MKFSKVIHNNIQVFLDYYYASSLLRSSSQEPNTEQQSDKQLEDNSLQESSTFLHQSETQPAQDLSDKHVWQHLEIVSLIQSMAVHHDDLSNVKKRKNVFENISNDLLSKGFSVNALMCKTKWKSLVRSYSAAIDNKSKTGRGPSRFQFFDEMDDILGKKPSQKCHHTLDTSDNSLDETSKENNLKGALMSKTGTDLNKKETFNTSTGEASCSNWEETPNPNKEENPNTNREDCEVPAKNKKCSEAAKNKRKRKNYEDYIKERRLDQDRKDRRHQERMALEREKLEIEKEKVKLFKKYLEEKK